MTATHVKGVPVVASEPALADFSTPERPVPFKQIVKLLLEDGTELFGCIHCDYTGASHLNIRPHLLKHANTSAAPKAKKPTLRDLTLAELLQRLDGLERVTADRDSWRTRALKAEGQLRGLRKTLRGDG